MYQNTTFTVGLSLFGCEVNILTNVHIVQCCQILALYSTVQWTAAHWKQVFKTTLANNPSSTLFYSQIFVAHFTHNFWLTSIARIGIDPIGPPPSPHPRPPTFFSGNQTQGVSSSPPGVDVKEPPSGRRSII